MSFGPFLQQMGANPAFRQTAAGVKLGRMVFDPSQGSIDPTIISKLLNAAGLPVPQSVRIGQDTAQIIMAGGAIATALDTAQDIQSFMNPGLSVIKATEDILATLGLMDPNGPAAQIINTGVDITMVATSAGLNVLADIALALDVVKQVFNFFPPDLTGQYQAYASSQASQILARQIQQREARAQNLIRSDFAEYHAGRIGIMDLIKNTAKDAPDLFSNYFPEVDLFIPPSAYGVVNFSASFTATGTQKVGLFDLGIRQYSVTETVSKDLRSLTQLSAVPQAVYDRYVNAPLLPYKFIDQATDRNKFPEDKRKQFVPHPKPVRRMSVLNWVALSLFPPYATQITPDLDIRPLLASLMLTPSDFDDDMLAYEMENGWYGSKQGSAARIDTTPAISINGVEKFSPAQSNYLQYASQYSNETKQIVSWDQRGDIYSLLKHKRSNIIIQEWGVLPDVPSYAFNDPNAARQDFLLKLMAQYRNLQNLFGALSMHDELMKTPGVNPMQSFEGGSAPLEFTLSDLEAKHKKLQMKSVGRKMNQKARAQIASYFNLKPDKIKIIPGATGQLAKVVSA